MGIGLTNEQVMAMAPDAASANAGKKLAIPRTWQHVGCSDAALWGECQGSALYQVRVDLSNYGVACSCPSHKFPCKHGLGLLLLAVQSPEAVPPAEPPDWVASWLAKRAASQEKKQEQLAKPAKETANPAQQAKRAAQKATRVDQGLNTLELWLRDLVRTGLASVESESAQIWEQQAKRLVDAQAPGVAALVRQMAGIPGASPDWPRRLLDHMGRIALLIQAYRQFATADGPLLLDLPMQDEIQRRIGWTLSQEDITARGEMVDDDWLLLGQVVEQDEAHSNMLMQRTWLYGVHSQRPALILQYSVMNAPYPEVIVPGGRLLAALRFWPGAELLRARIEIRHPASPLPGDAPILLPLPGAPDIATFLQAMAERLARQPWQTQNLCLLRSVVPLCEDNGARWWLQDSHGDALPLAGDNHWKLLALTGGNPVAIAAEWDGERLRVMGVQHEGRYTLLGGNE